MCYILFLVDLCFLWGGGGGRVAVRNTNADECLSSGFILISVFRRDNGSFTTDSLSSIVARSLNCKSHGFPNGAAMYLLLLSMPQVVEQFAYISQKSIKTPLVTLLTLYISRDGSSENFHCNI